MKIDGPAPPILPANSGPQSIGPQAAAAADAANAADGSEAFRALLETQTGTARAIGLPAAGTAATGASSAVASVLSLLALQGDAIDPRTAALRKGKRLIDALDRLQVALLENGPGPAQLVELRNALAERVSASGDGELDDLIVAAEVRAAVEAAKYELVERAFP